MAKKKTKSGKAEVPLDASMPVVVLHGKEAFLRSRAGHDLMSILAGIALYGLMTQLHIVLIGVPVVTLGG